MERHDRQCMEETGDGLSCRAPHYCRQRFTDSPTVTPEYQTDPEQTAQPASKHEVNSEAGIQGKQGAEQVATTSPLAQAVPRAPEPDPESAHQEPSGHNLPDHSQAGGFDALDKAVHGQAPPLAHLQSDLGQQTMALRVQPVEELSKSVLHLRVHIPTQSSALLTQPLADTTPMLVESPQEWEAANAKAELARLKQQLRISTSARAREIVAQFDARVRVKH